MVAFILPKLRKKATTNYYATHSVMT